MLINKIKICPSRPVFTINFVLVLIFLLPEWWTLHKRLEAKVVSLNFMGEDQFGFRRDKGAGDATSSTMSNK